MRSPGGDEKRGFRKTNQRRTMRNNINGLRALSQPRHRRRAAGANRGRFGETKPPRHEIPCVAPATHSRYFGKTKYPFLRKRNQYLAEWLPRCRVHDEFRQVSRGPAPSKGRRRSPERALDHVCARYVFIARSDLVDDPPWGLSSCSCTPRSAPRRLADKGDLPSVLLSNATLFRMA